jgi:hypothetical protein
MTFFESSTGFLPQNHPTRQAMWLPLIDEKWWTAKQIIMALDSELTNRLACLASLERWRGDRQVDKNSHIKCADPPEQRSSNDLSLRLPFFTTQIDSNKAPRRLLPTKRHTIEQIPKQSTL